MKRLVFGLLGMSILMTGMAEGIWGIPDEWMAPSIETATYSAERHYKIGEVAFSQERWGHAARQFLIVSGNFPLTELGQEAKYQLGICYYEMEEFELANDVFNEYLKGDNNPQFFEEALTYKYKIACRYKEGEKKRVFGARKLPKWIPGDSLAIVIFDEVIATVPCHELAARSMFSKAELLKEQFAYNESILGYQQLIRRFPRHELAPESYIKISEVYLERAKAEPHNTDLMDFAQLNVRKFEMEYPREERVAIVEANLQTLKEMYAQTLFDTGQFYERTLKIKASVVYYYSVLKKFPETSVAELCKERLKALRVKKD